MKKRMLALSVSILMALSLITGCSGRAKDSGTAAGATADTTVAGSENNSTAASAAEAAAPTAAKGVIKLGGLAPLTGNYAEYGKGFQIGFDMALEKINASGGVNGYTFAIEVKDSEGDAVKSSTLATDYAEDDSIMAILGDFTSGACKANTEIVDRYKLVQLSPTASAADYASMSEYCFSIMGRHLL